MSLFRVRSCRSQRVNQSFRRSAVDLPAGTPSAKAIAAFEASYPYVSTWAPAFIVQHTSTLPTICGSVTQNFSTALSGFLAGYPSVVESTSGYWELWGTPLLRPLALDAVSPNNRTLITTVTFKRSTTLDKIQLCVDEMTAFAAGRSTADVSIATTGLTALFDEMSAATASNFLTIDAVVLPIAIIILGARVQVRWSAQFEIGRAHV